MSAGVVYLLHFDRRYKHAAHYLGSTTGPLADRLDAHRSGRGARLMEVVTNAGISFQLARVWRGGRTIERRLKNYGGAAQLCPFCRPFPKPARFAPAARVDGVPPVRRNRARKPAVARSAPAARTHLTCEPAAPSAALDVAQATS